MRAVKSGIVSALAIAASADAMAGTVHHVRFAQPAQILVWESGALIAHGDRIRLTDDAPARSHDLMGAGTLLPADEPVRERMIVAIASNTAFSLNSDDPSSAGNVVVRVLGAGENAQVQSETMPQTLFRQGAKTGIRRGAPASQAIELEISWSGEVAPTLTLTAD